MRVSRTIAVIAAAGVVAGAMVAPSAAADSTVSIAVTADTFTASSSPSSNYGGSLSLGVYGTPAITTVLRVVVPPPPVGESLSSATLTLTTTTIASAGSADAVQVRPALDGWNETDTVYANRPVVLDKVLGTLPGGSAPGRAYDVPLDVSGLSGASGSMTLALVGTGTDSSWFWSREAAAALRPVLKLRYTSTPTTDTEAPSTPDGVTASVDGSSVHLDWNASTDNVGVTGYRVHRGSTADFAPAPSNQVGQPTVPSFVENGVAAGEWFYRVVATDAAGNVSDASTPTAATVSEPPPPADPVTLQVQPTEDAMVVAAAPDTTYGSSSQLSTRGASSPLQSFLRFALPDAPTGMKLTAASLTLRTSTDPTAGSLDAQSVRLLNDAGWRESTVTWSNRPTGLGSEIGILAQAPATNTPYSFGLGAAQLVPLLGTTQSLAMTASGADNARWWSREAPYAPYRPVLTLTFEKDATPPPADTQPPSIPTALTAAVTGTSVALSWQQSTDDRAVTGYTVHRSTNADFTPVAGTRVADVAATTYLDSDRSAGTWYYRVVAYDAAGNRSDGSSAAAATVRTAGPPVVRILPVASDTFTSAGSPSANYGTSSSLGVYGTPSITALMRVELPEPPAGSPVTAVSLKVRTSTLSSAGSADPVRVRFAADSWTETGTVYSNRPAVSGSVLGTLAPGTVPDTAYDIPLSPESFAGKTGSVTLALEGTGGDSTWLWSREATVASYRPVLSITYQGSAVDPPPPGLTATIMAVGDLACESGTPVTSTTCRHAEVADLIASSGVDRFIALGDLQYQDATLAQFRGSGAYDDTFGRLRSSTLPVLGNHEYHVSTDGYFDYFYGAGTNSGPFGDRATGYYTTTVGSWRYIALNTECDAGGVAGGCAVGSPQYEWLKNLLVYSPAQCTIVAGHRPRWSTGASHGSYSQMSALWDLMAANGVDVYLAAHNHVAEAFAPIGVSGSSATPTMSPDGIRSFTSGSGGANIQGFSPTTDPLLSAVEARSRSAFGPLKMTLTDGGYSWEFVPIAGMTFTASGTTGSFSGSDDCN